MPSAFTDHRPPTTERRAPRAIAEHKRCRRSIVIRARLEYGDLVTTDRKHQPNQSLYVDQPCAFLAVLVEEFEADDDIAFVVLAVGGYGRPHAITAVNDLQSLSPQDVVTPTAASIADQPRSAPDEGHPVGTPH